MKRFNDKLAVIIANSVGTMVCAYIFTVIGVMGIIGAFTGNTWLVLVIGSVSGYFLQLVLLPIIMVSQNIQSAKHDEHATKLDAITQHLGVTIKPPEDNQ